MRGVEYLKPHIVAKTFDAVGFQQRDATSAHAIREAKIFDFLMVGFQPSSHRALFCGAVLLEEPLRSTRGLVARFDTRAFLAQNKIPFLLWILPAACFSRMQRIFYFACSRATARPAEPLGDSLRSPVSFIFAKPLDSEAVETERFIALQTSLVHDDGELLFDRFDALDGRQEQPSFGSTFVLHQEAIGSRVQSIERGRFECRQDVD